MTVCCGVWPWPGRGTVEYSKQRHSSGGGQNRAHPETQLAEIAVLDDGNDDGTAQEHGYLTQKEKDIENVNTQAMY